MMKLSGTVRQPFDKQLIVSSLGRHSNYNCLNGSGLDSHSKGNQPNILCLGKRPWDQPLHRVWLKYGRVFLDIFPKRMFMFGPVLLLLYKILSFCALLMVV